MPILVVFIIALGVGGKQLSNPPAADVATVPAILGFAATIAGFDITYSALSSDFTSYFQPDVSRFVFQTASYLYISLILQYSIRIFSYSYLGFLLPIVR